MGLHIWYERMEGKRIYQEMYEAGMRTGVIAILGFVFIFLLIVTGYNERPYHSGAFDQPMPVKRSNLPLSSGRLSAAYAVPGDETASIVGQDEEEYGSYLVRITNYENEGFLEIFKSGKQIHSLHNPSNFSFASFDEGKNYIILMGPDITGNGQPDLVISEWSLGAHCCYTFHVFEIGDTFACIQSIDAGSSESAHFRNLDSMPDLEFVMNDWTFAYWYTNFADSPAPQVILKFNGRSYAFARELMKKDPPSEARLGNLTGSIRMMDDWRMGVPPMELWTQMIDLIYSGNMAHAWKLFDLAWPGNMEGKDEILLDFRAKLKESPFYQDLLSINR